MSRKLSLSLITPGSLKHNRARFTARQNGPTPRGTLGSASRWLNTRERRIWKQIVSTSPGQLGESDRPLLEIIVTLKAKLEAHDITAAQITQLISALGKLGMIPLDRHPVDVKKEADEWQDFKDGA